MLILLDMVKNKLGEDHSEVAAIYDKFNLSSSYYIIIIYI